MPRVVVFSLFFAIRKFDIKSIKKYVDKNNVML